MALYVFMNTKVKVKVPKQKQPYLGSYSSQRPEIFTVTFHAIEDPILKFLPKYSPLGDGPLITTEAHTYGSLNSWAAKVVINNVEDLLEMTNAVACRRNYTTFWSQGGGDGNQALSFDKSSEDNQQKGPIQVPFTTSYTTGRFVKVSISQAMDYSWP